MQSVHHDELKIPVRFDFLANPRNVAARDALHDGEVVTKAYRRGADGGARHVVQRPASKVVQARAPLDGQRPLQNTVRKHLAGVEDRWPPPLGDAKRHGQRERALAAGDIATQNDQISPAESTAEQLVQARESGRNGVGGRRTISDGIDAPEEKRQGGNVCTSRHGPRYGAPSVRSNAIRHIWQAPAEGPTPSVSVL